MTDLLHKGSAAYAYGEEIREKASVWKGAKQVGCADISYLRQRYPDKVRRINAGNSPGTLSPEILAVLRIGATNGGGVCSVKATKGTLEGEMNSPNVSRVNVIWSQTVLRLKRLDIA